MPQVLDRKVAPAIYNATEFDFVLQPIDTVKCSNGIQMHYINGGAQKVISIEWIFEAGSWHTTQFATAQATAALLKSGTSSKTALQIDEIIDFYGANLKVACGSDFANVQLTCLSKHVPQLLPLIKELFVDASFPQQELDLHNQNYLQRLKVNLSKGDFVANRKIDEFIFGYNHPYGHYNTEQTITQVTREALLAHRDQFYSSARCTLFVAGKFEPSVLEAIENIFGTDTWGSATMQAVPQHTIVTEPQKKHRIVNDEKAVQGAIRIAREFPTKFDPNFAQLILLNTVYGGYFGSRLMSNIREDKGYTYGIYSYIYNNKYAGAFGISTECGKDVSEAAVAEVYKEMELMREQVVSEEELQLVKNYILGGLLGDMDGPFQMIQRWKNLILNGFTVEKFNTNIAVYKNCTGEELQALAKQYFNPDEFWEVIVY
ncbi:MAG: hypothetical protein RL660_1100 [Bacteroidota bacterium]|jgi:predicted Zn-dependent peptidase